LEGIDLVLEGEAIRATDKGTLERLAGRYRAVGWPAEVDGDALTAPFSAPSTGPPPWQLYRFVPQTGFGVAAEEPYGATRCAFDDLRLSRNSTARAALMATLAGKAPASP
jgi:hypothetical protein